MRHAWTIAAKDLRRRLRDRTAMLVALVLPFGLAWIFSLTLGDVETAGSTRPTPSSTRTPAATSRRTSRGVLEGLDFVTLRDVDGVADGGDAGRGRRHRRGVRLPRRVHRTGAGRAGAARSA